MCFATTAAATAPLTCATLPGINLLLWSLSSDAVGLKAIETNPDRSNRALTTAKVVQEASSN